MIDLISVKNAVNKLNKITADTKPLFELAIKNRQIPLEDRWNLFISASDSLKNHNPFVVDFKTLPDVSWYNAFYADRYTTLYTKNIVERIVDAIGYEHDHTFDAFKADANLLNELKEEILERNLCSFVNDW